MYTQLEDLLECAVVIRIESIGRAKLTPKQEDDIAIVAKAIAPLFGEDRPHAISVAPSQNNAAEYDTLLRSLVPTQGGFGLCTPILNHETGVNKGDFLSFLNEEIERLDDPGMLIIYVDSELETVADHIGAAAFNHQPRSHFFGGNVGDAIFINRQGQHYISCSG